MDSSQSQPVEIKKQEKMIGLPPKIPTMIRPNIKHELPVAEKSMAQPSSCKGKEVVTESSIKIEVDIDDKRPVNIMDDSVADAKRREKRWAYVSFYYKVLYRFR